MGRRRGHGAGLRRGVEFVRQRVRTEAELHQGLGFGKSRGRKSMIRLKTLHRHTRGLIPFAARFPIQITESDQGLLDFRGALGLQFQAGQAGARAFPAIPAARGGGFL